MTDTPKQRKLEARLAMAGKGSSWRRWLLEQKEDGHTDVEIAHWLRSVGLEIDPSTLGIWRRQAEAERGPVSGATDRAA